jgi:hypothetical protein
MNQADKDLMMSLARQWLREYNSLNADRALPDDHPHNVLELHPFRNTTTTHYNYIDMFQSKPSTCGQTANDWRIKIKNWTGEEIEISSSSAIADLSYPFKEFQLSIRVMNCFRNEGIITINDLVNHTEDELYRLPNFGRKSINEVKAMLATLGLSLATLVEKKDKYDKIPGYPFMATPEVDDK